MIIKKKITFALEFRCKDKQKNGEKEITQVSDTQTCLIFAKAT